MLTSIAFSLTRDLRVPSSGHGVGFVAWSGSFSASPEGSKKTGMRAFGRGGAGAEKTSSLIEGARVAPVRVVRDEGSPSTLRRLAEAAVAAPSSGWLRAEGIAGEAIMRFWNSRCFDSRRSRGVALRAIPRRYVSSASTRLCPHEHSYGVSECYSYSPLSKFERNRILLVE